MNTSLSPESSVELLTSHKGFPYGIFFSVGIIMVITITLAASYVCRRISTVPVTNPRTRLADGGADVERGLDEATLMSYPKVQYSELAKLGGGSSRSSSSSGEKGSTATCCSICLADYEDSDELRQLPECGHEFHLKCVDPWLRLHASCPVCRAPPPLPTPMPTPLAEVVPLARQESRIVVLPNIYYL